MPQLRDLDLVHLKIAKFTKMLRNVLEGLPLLQESLTDSQW